MIDPLNTWIATDFFCPCCGLRTVEKDDDSDDYYVGSLYRCHTCYAEWNFPVEPTRLIEEPTDAR